MIERLVSVYQNYYGQVAMWYHGSDMLTQYVIVVASGIFILLLSMVMFFSRFTK